MDTRHIIVLFLMLVTLAVLIAGVCVMMIGGKLNAKYSNKLMVARVAFQALTIFAIAAFFYMGK